MGQKVVHIPDIGDVILQKRRTNKNIKLSISHDGKVRVTIPFWTPYVAAEAFLQSKLDWIRSHTEHRQPHMFRAGERVGKAHRLRFVPTDSDTITSRVTETQIIIRHPHQFATDNPEVQAITEKAAIRALKAEAKRLLPQRLADLANQHGFTYASVDIKQLKTRWGSCSSHQEIVLNCYLMQLPWDLIDYVIMHELMHTRVMSHSADFWRGLDAYVPHLASKRKLIKLHRPAVKPEAP